MFKLVILTRYYWMKGGITVAKPDNRADNEAHLQQHIENTKANMQEAEQYLNEFSNEISASEKHTIEEKNERRKHSIEGFKEELKDEAGQ